MYLILAYLHLFDKIIIAADRNFIPPQKTRQFFKTHSHGGLPEICGLLMAELNFKNAAESIYGMTARVVKIKMAKIEWSGPKAERLPCLPQRATMFIFCEQPGAKEERSANRC